MANPSYIDLPASIARSGYSRRHIERKIESGELPAVKIKGQNVDSGGRWFQDFDEARLHALDYVLDIFEEEQKILA